MVLKGLWVAGVAASLISYAQREGEGRKRIGVTIGISCYTCYPSMQAKLPNVEGEALPLAHRHVL